MNYLDIIIIIPLLWGAYKGFSKGLIIEVASLIALVLGVWGGVKFSSYSAAYLSDFLEISATLMPLISFAVTFILIVIAVYTLAKMLEKIIKLVALSLVNKISGGAFGALKFALILSVVFSLVNTLNQELHFIPKEVQESSILYRPIGLIAPLIIPGLKEINLNGMVEDAVIKEAHQRIDEASFVNE